MTEVKICGLSTPSTVDVALRAGAGLIGFVFFPKSPRYVSVEQAAALAGPARGKARIVALVVDSDDATLLEINRIVNPDLFQAQGAETPARVAEIRALTGKPVIKAVSVAGAGDIAAAENYATSAALILYDAKTADGPLPGGNGIAFDWSLLKGQKKRDFILAGGLTPANVAEAIRLTGAAIVDVSSGVERAPGVKDTDLIRKFIEAARPAR